LGVRRVPKVFGDAAVWHAGVADPLKTCSYPRFVVIPNLVALGHNLPKIKWCSPRGLMVLIASDGGYTPCLKKVRATFIFMITLANVDQLS